MVREFGMSQTLGPVGFATGSPMYLGGEEVRSRPYAEATQRVIDQEVAKLLREAEDRASVMLGEHRDALDRLTELLLERETVDGTDVDGVLGRIPGQHQPIGATGHTSHQGAGQGTSHGEGKGEQMNASDAVVVTTHDRRRTVSTARERRRQGEAPDVRR